MLKKEEGEKDIRANEQLIIRSDVDLGFGERAFSAAGAAALSAVIVNPLDVAKVSSNYILPQFFNLNSVN